MDRRTLPTNLLVSGLLSRCLWGIWEGELITRSLGCPPSPAEALGPLGLGSAQGKQGLWGENTRQPRAGIGNLILWAASTWALKTRSMGFQWGCGRVDDQIQSWVHWVRPPLLQKIHYICRGWASTPLLV